jgi:Heparinase II/III-like protein/Heparinase II/III N-terminus
MKGISPRLRTGLHAYRQLGPRHGTATVARHVTRAGQDRLRRLMLERRPLRVSSAELATALGAADPARALVIACRALPSVRRWATELSQLNNSEHDGLLTRADDVLAHRFNLLGSGPTELGPVIDWHRDFKTGRSWPMEHISRIPVSYPDSSDIKVPWELSRFQHLPLLAAAYRISADRRYLDEIEAQLTSWIAANPVEFGVNWSCTMDVAIRGVNWVAALALCAADASSLPCMGQVMENLLLHARFIRSHLEYGSARGNHYLSDVVGLLVISAVFSGSAEGRAWAYWAVRELGREMRHQVRADGCDHEASISYHRLVTELFIVGADAADVLVPGALGSEVRQGLDRMLGFVADYTRPDGLAPQIGDADDGRLLPLGDYAAAEQRSHLHLFGQAGRIYQPATRSAAYRHGGFYILRGGDLYAAVRCGDVGIYGRGCHAHNDLMAFELACGTVPLIVDPGSYLYTADPAARNRFRSTAFHSALQLDGVEQNELRVDRLFSMVDRAQPTILSWESDPTATTFRGRHRGFEHLAARASHTRSLRLDGVGATLEIVDEVTSEGPHDLTLSLPLAPCKVQLGSDVVVARFAEVTLCVQAVGLRPSLHDGWLSPSYGVRIRAPVIRLSGRSAPGTHRTVVTLAVQ